MNYPFLIFSQEYILQNQALEEILRDRSNSYLLRNKIVDFWILISPKFLLKFEENIENSSFFFENKKTILSPRFIAFYSVLISANKDFLEWLKLRLGYFRDIQKDKRITIKRIKPITIIGLFGTIELKELNSINFSSQNFFLHSTILSEKYDRILQTYKEKLLFN